MKQLFLMRQTLKPRIMLSMKIKSSHKEHIKYRYFTDKFNQHSDYCRITLTHPEGKIVVTPTTNFMRLLYTLILN